MNNIVPWVLDTFGMYTPILLLFILFILSWIFLRPRMLAWVKRDPALQEKKVNMLTNVSLTLVLFALVMSLSR